MQVLSDGRVRRSASEWRAIVERFESSGLSEAGFCRKAKVSRKAFRLWRKRLAEGEAPPRRGRATRKPKPEPVGFVEWLAPASPPPGAERQAGVEFELTLPGGVVFRWRA